jgi:hypothetical protein
VTRYEDKLRERPVMNAYSYSTGSRQGTVMTARVTKDERDALADALEAARNLGHGHATRYVEVCDLCSALARLDALATTDAKQPSPASSSSGSSAGVRVTTERVHGSSPKTTDGMTDVRITELLGRVAEGFTPEDRDEAWDEIKAEVERLLEERDRLAERLAGIRPLNDAEWKVICRQDDVIHEARRLSRSAGLIKTTGDLDRAIQALDDAREGASKAGGSGGGVH